MPFSRRTLMAAAATAGGGIATSAVAAGPEPTADLIRRSEAANDALMRGDVDRYRELIPVTDDFTLMAPFGGEPTRGMNEDRWAAMKRFFRNGALKQEVVQTYVTAEMAVLAVIEHATVSVGGLPPQKWTLRVTMVFRRDGDRWALAHRHADPLALGVSLQQAAALGRGAPAA